MPRRRPTTNGHVDIDDTIPMQPIPSTELVLYNSGKALDMAIFEREIGRILNRMRDNGRRDEDTMPAIMRAVDTYEAAQR